MNIADYGWDENFAQEWQERSSAGMFPGRIVADYGQMLRVVANEGEFLVNRPGKGPEQELQLAVGDWVGLVNLGLNQGATIRLLLSRKTKFSRTAAGIEVKEQIVAANVDTVFIIQSLNRDFNMRRLERYLIAAWESAATPVVVLTKADCCDHVAEKLATVSSTAPGVEVMAISSLTGEGIEDIKRHFLPGKTVAFLGSSGVGKSTLANKLMGEEHLRTREIRENDGRGRHTTSHRELLLLAGGGLILDTPGMRALLPWEADTGMEVMFGDVEELTKLCRFSDCQHENEPGCAVKQALVNGELAQKRWESWGKLQKELKHLEAKKAGKVRQQRKEWGKQIAKLQKDIYKDRPGR